MDIDLIMKLQKGTLVEAYENATLARFWLRYFAKNDKKESKDC